MGPYGDMDNLPDVAGVDNAPDQVLRRRAWEDAGWQFREDAHGSWHAERGEDHAESPLLRWLIDELESRFLLYDFQTRSTEND